MNNEYENNMRFLPILKFFDKYKKVIILIILTIIISIGYFVLSNQAKKQNNEKASLIYTEWLKEISLESPDTIKLNNMLEQLLAEFKNTGYAQLALLNKARFG